MTMATLGRRIVVVLGMVAIVGAMPVITRAQQPGPATTSSSEYVIGNEDVLQISVWSRPDLERTVTVNAAGNIVFPPIGEIRATGFTPRQLADRLSDRMSTYLRQGATTVTVIVREYLSRSAYVSGAVAKPGRYGAEQPLNIVDAINLAGGALPNGDLGRVIIIRRTGPGPRQLTVDVATAMRDGTVESLPTLMPGDMVVVPTSVSLVGGAGDQGVGVLGEVHRPGLYPVAPNEDLWMALALAGGPTPRSNLSTIKVLTKDSNVHNAVTVDLKQTLSRGNRRPYVIKPGDIVFVDARGASVWQAFSTLLGVTRDVASIVAVIRVLENNP